MALTITINHFADTFSGHANITIGGSLNGVVYEPITIGSNSGPNAGYLDLFAAVFLDHYGDTLGNFGVIRDESDLLNNRPFTPYMTTIDSENFDAWFEAYSFAENVQQNEYVNEPYDLFGLYTDGLNCIEFVNNTLTSMNGRIFDEVPIGHLMQTLAGQQYAYFQLNNILAEQGISFQIVPPAAKEAFLEALMIIEAINGEDALGEAAIKEIASQVSSQLMWQTDDVSFIRASIFEALDIPRCFPAGTPILLPFGQSAAIDELSIGTFVMAVDDAADGGRGALKPCRVTKLFTNVTQDFLLLTYTNAAGETIEQAVTPGHDYLNELGDWEDIASIWQRNGQIVLEDGGLTSFTAELQSYSTSTAHLYPQAQITRYATQGGLACEPWVETGWATYNCEVEGLHSYVANGVRAHNLSALDFWQPGDGVLNPDSIRYHDENNSIDEAVFVTDTKVTRVTFDPSETVGHNIATREITEELPDGEFWTHVETAEVDSNGVVVEGSRKHLFGRGLGESVGQALTPFLANAIHGEDANVFEQIATETVLDTVLGNIGEFVGVATHKSFVGRLGNNEVNLFANVFNDIGEELVLNLGHNTVSVVNRLIMAEIFDSIEVDGIAGDIFEGLVSSGLDVITSNLVDAVFDEVLPAAIADQFHPSNFTPTSVGNIVLAAVLNEVLPEIETTEGMIANAVINAALTYLLPASFISTAGLSTTLAALAPLGPVAFAMIFANIVAKAFDAFFGDDPVAYTYVGLNSETGLFEITGTWQDDGGNTALSIEMAEQYVEVMNTAVSAVSGEADTTSILQRYFGHNEDIVVNGETQTYYYMVDQQVGPSTQAEWELEVNQGTPQQAIYNASLADLAGLLIYGGDAKVKKAIDDALEGHAVASVVSALSALEYGDLTHSIATSTKIVWLLSEIGISAPVTHHYSSYQSYDGENASTPGTWVTHVTENWFEWHVDTSSLSAFLSEIQLPDSQDDSVGLTDLMARMIANINIAQDYQTYLENTESINALMTVADGSNVAAGWAATLIAAVDMGLAEGYTETGSDGNNTFWTADGDDIVHGLGGDDIIYSYAGDDQLFGGAGDDKLFAGDDLDILYGGDGDDVLNAGAYDSSDQSNSQFLYGEAGNDDYVISSDHGRVAISNDAELASGEGYDGTIDRVVFDDLALSDITVSYRDYTGTPNAASGNALILSWDNGDRQGELALAHEGSRIEEFEFADGSTVSGFGGAGQSWNRFNGTSGDDLIVAGNTDHWQMVFGGTGDDTLQITQARTQNQYLYGQDGSDTYLFSSTGGQQTIDWNAEVDTPGDVDRVVFTDLNLSDLSISYTDAGGVYGQVLELSWDNGINAGQVRIANEGDAIEEFEFADGSTVSSLELASYGRTILRGTSGDDLIIGSSTDDEIYGGDGDDTLTAGDGDGAGGGQYLGGQAGDDTYLITKSDSFVFIGGHVENASMGDADRVVFNDLNLSDITISYLDYGSSVHGNAIRLMWDDGTDSGELRIANEGDAIEEFEFADGSTVSSLELASYGRTILRGTSGDDLIIGSSTDDEIYGGDGDDTLTAGDGDGAGGGQYLGGQAGDDTYLITKSDSFVFIGGHVENASMGDADRVVFNDLNLSDITISYLDYGSSVHGNAIRLMWDDGTDSGELRIANEGDHIEEFQFSDGTIIDDWAIV